MPAMGVVLVVSQLCSGEFWCGFKRDNFGRGRAAVTATFSGVSSLVQLWSASLSAATGRYSGPAVFDVTGDGIPDIVVGDNSGYVRCFNGPDGTVHWSRYFGSSVYSTPAVGDIDGNPSTVEVAVVVGSNLYVLEGATGNTIWSAYIGTYPDNGSPRLADLNGDGVNDVIVGSYSRTTAYNGPDGSQIWSNSSVRADATVPVVADLNGDGIPDVVVSDDNSNRLVALNGSSGHQLWAVPLSGSYPTSPAVEDIDGDGLLDIIVSTQSYMYRVDQYGNTIWNAPINMTFSSDAHESPVIGWDVNGDGVKDIFQSGYGNPELKAISGADGTTIWTNSTLVETHGSAPITAGEFETSNSTFEILYNDHDGYLNVIDAASGSVLWSYRYGSGPFGSGYSVLADVNADTCIDFVLRGESDSPIIAVFTSSVYGTCYLSWEDPEDVNEATKEKVGRVLVERGGVRVEGEGRYEVYSPTGRRMTAGSVKGSTFLPLPHGVYIVKFNGKVYSVSVR